MPSQPSTATKRVFAAAALRNGIAVTATARRIGKQPGSVGWQLKKAGLKPDTQKQPTDCETRGAGRAPARSRRRGDPAFQRAMRRAIAQGREQPPMIGVFKDDRPLDAPRLFEPVPHSSGCTSPALVCAEWELEPIDPLSPLRRAAAVSATPV
jgi:hypothetical protein